MDNKFIRVDEVAQELSVSKPYAYKLIKKLNDELKEQGFITIAGRVNRQYFQEMILSRLVDTFSSRILYPMLLLSGNHSIAAVLSWEEDLH